MKKPKKKVKFHWLSWQHWGQIPTSCECGGKPVVVCERLFKQMTKKK